MTPIVDSSVGEAVQLIRSDSKGRVLVPADQRDVLLDASEQSGQPAMAFCRQHDLKYPTFATWVQKRRRGSEPAVPRFAEVTVDLAGHSGAAACAGAHAHHAGRRDPYRHRLPQAARLGGGAAAPSLPATVMLTLSGSLRVFVALEPCDMRKTVGVGVLDTGEAVEKALGAKDLEVPADLPAVFGWS